MEKGKAKLNLPLIYLTLGYPRFLNFITIISMEHNLCFRQHADHHARL